jgi:hypothetical protein
MSHSVLWQERRTALLGCTAQVLAACLIVGWVLLLSVRALNPPVVTLRECRSDPWDFLPAGELLEASALAFIVEAHCANAKYVPEGWIELSYGGGRLDVELRRVDIADRTYFRIVSIGGIAAQ